MSVTQARHCDCCGELMEQQYAQFVMPARPEPVAGAPLMVVPFSEEPLQQMQMIVRVYDCCRQCAARLESGFVATVERVKTRISIQQREQMADRLRDQFRVTGEPR